MKRKIILSSIMTIILSLSLIAGSTLALFTSQSQVNISVSSAKVNILSVIEQNSLELYSLDVKQDVQFENGGTAEFTDAATLVLNNVTPGDKAVFDIVMTNESTVDVQYQVAWSVNGSLAGGLVAKADGQKIVNGKSAWTLWKTPTSDAEATRTITVSIELPVEAGNEYQDGKAEIALQLIAVQGNGTELLTPVCDVLATPETIDEILATVAPNTVIGLAKGKYGSIKLTQDGLTLVTYNAVVDYVNVNAKKNCTLDGITFDAAGAKMAYNSKGTALNIYTNVASAEKSDVPAKDLTIQNCIFTGTPADPDNFVSICFYERNRSGGGINGATITGCTFETDAAYYVYMYYPGYKRTGEFVITNNKFGTSSTTVSSASAIYAGNTQGDTTVSGNVFTNSGITITPHNGASCSYALNIAVTDNQFVNTTDSVMTVIGLRHFHSLPKCTAVVKGNEAMFGSTLSNAYIDALSYECYDITPANAKVLRATNDAELAAALATVKANSTYWNTPVIISLAANIYSADYDINQYPEWNGVVGAGSSANNMSTLKGDENVANITILGDDGVTFTGNVTINGFGNAGTGFTKATNASTVIKNVTFDAANHTDDQIALYVKAAANNVSIEGCTFENASHVTVGGSGANAIGTVSFDECFFNNGNCISGYVANALTVTNSTAKNAYKGFINVQNKSNVTVDNCNVECSEFFLRTNGVNVATTVTNSTITVNDAGEGSSLVLYRGSGHTATFTGCTLTYAVENGGAGTGTITIN
ncbi:MAG: hypothetical protein IKC63_04295 [Clostridia bacterium]|nr:hypothetical protein [Clostridia bacterium]